MTPMGEYLAEQLYPIEIHVSLSLLTHIDECNETIYAPFDNACSVEQRRNGTFMSQGRDFIFDGEFFFGIPSFSTGSSIWIDRVSNKVTQKY